MRWDDVDDCLKPTRFIDSDDPAVAAFAREAAGGAATAREKALKVFYRVRDEIAYDPYGVDMRPEAFRASSCLAAGKGFCVYKAVLLTACLRAVGVPARLGFADVKNHLSTERLRALMKTDVFAWHGYSEVGLDGRWIKATPAFNLSLCEKFGVKPLDWDGYADSVFHAYDRAGRRHMEYVAERGAYDDLPYDEIRACFAELYPFMFGAGAAAAGAADFQAEAAAERAP
jgi:transglutaminase-like putative cysteine protease